MTIPNYNLLGTRGEYKSSGINHEERGVNRESGEWEIVGERGEM